MRASRFLVDTSVWLEVLPPGQKAAALRERVDELLAEDRVATTPMVRLELLGGARSEGEWQRLSAMLSAVHLLAVDDASWDEAARLGFQLRCVGVTIPFTDLLIGAVALRNGATLLHRDRHFDLMASHVPLGVESHVAS